MGALLGTDDKGTGVAGDMLMTPNFPPQLTLTYGFEELEIPGSL